MAGKDLWIKIKIDDKELEEIGKKTKKTLEGSVEKARREDRCSYQEAD